MWWLICLLWLQQCLTYMKHKTFLLLRRTGAFLPKFCYSSRFLWLMLKLLHNNNNRTKLFYHSKLFYKNSHVFNPILCFIASPNETYWLTCIFHQTAAMLIAIWCILFWKIQKYDSKTLSQRNNVSMGIFQCCKEAVNIKATWRQIKA